MLAESLPDEARYAELVKMLRPDYPFTHVGYHFGAEAEPTSRTMRVVRDGKNLIKKEYLGQLNEKTEHEIGLLMAVARKGLQHTASFKTVHAKTCNLSGDTAPTLELLMSNYGLDLEDWSFLLRKGGFEFWGSPYFHLAIWDYVLSAMKELHQANLVQVDVKSDNICVALPKFTDAASPDASGRIALKFNLKELTLIDLGEALHPDTNKRVLLFHTNGMVLGPGNKYISRHYVKRKALVKPNDMKPLRSLDWRVDFYALGCAVEDWNLSTRFSASPPAYLSRDEKSAYGDAIDLLQRLPMWLKSADTDPSTEAGDMPHDGLIKKIGKVLNLEKWDALEFTLPGSIGAAPISTARTHVDFKQSTDNDDPPARLPSRPRAAKETLLENPPNMFRRKGEQAHVSAQPNLGERRRKGRGVAKSNVDAVNWYRKAAEQGEAPPTGIDLLC
jgi:serine/threonine protein kinase